MVTPNSRSTRLMVIGLWVMTMKRVSVRRAHVVEQVAEAFDIGVVERRVDLVEHADRRRIGQEHGKDQAQRRQRLLAARQKRHGLRLLARRPGDDLEPGLERIVALDEGEIGGAAAEQRGEQVLEMGVDRRRTPRSAAPGLRG